MCVAVNTTKVGHSFGSGHWCCSRDYSPRVCNTVFHYLGNLGFPGLSNGNHSSQIFGDWLPRGWGWGVISVFQLNMGKNTVHTTILKIPKTR